MLQNMKINQAAYYVEIRALSNLSFYSDILYGQNKKNNTSFHRINIKQTQSLVKTLEKCGGLPLNVSLHSVY